MTHRSPVSTSRRRGERYLRQDHADACVMCQAGGATGPDCKGHHYAVLPGGHIEPGETPEQAALRELNEETTLTAEIDRLLWTSTHNGRPAYYFLMANVSGTPQLSGDDAEAHNKNNRFELVWTGLSDLDAFGIYPSDVQPNLSQLIGGE